MPFKKVNKHLVVNQHIFTLTPTHLAFVKKKKKLEKDIRSLIKQCLVLKFITVDKMSEIFTHMFQWKVFFYGGSLVNIGQ